MGMGRARKLKSLPDAGVVGESAVAACYLHEMRTGKLGHLISPSMTASESTPRIGRTEILPCNTFGVCTCIRAFNAKP